MNRAAIVLGAALSLAARVGATDPSDRLVVVHDAGGTVSAGPWVERPAISEATRNAALAHARASLAALAPPAAAFFPVKAEPLRSGRPSRIRVRGLSRPVFAVGCDPASLAWLARNAARLRDGGARGFLVSAPSAQAAERARGVAARLGLALDPMPGAALADAYGARAYPFLAEPSP